MPFPPPVRHADVAAIDRNRRAIFAAAGEVLRGFARVEREAQDWRDRMLVWSHGVALGDPAVAIASDGSHLRVEWERGIVASLVARIGECRIGLLLDRVHVPDVSVLGDFWPYPARADGAASCPARIIRNLGESQVLVDFVFSGCRLGEPSLTRDALRGHGPDMALLADALAQETLHLVSALVHHLAVMGVYLGDGAAADMQSVVFHAAYPDVGRALGLTPAQIYPVGAGEVPGTRTWMALIPPGQMADFEIRLQALSHLEFLDRQRIDETIEVVGLKIHASPGVYHPGPGSSTRFLLDALARDEAFAGDGTALRVLDLGCGSGVLALWIKRRFPQWDVFGSDLDARAVRDAQDNAQDNGIDVPFAEADLLTGLPGHGRWHGPFDRIVWNYPFWQVGRYDDSDFEHIAIDENGQLLRRLFDELPSRLRDGGLLYLTYSTLSSRDLLLGLCRDAKLDPAMIVEEPALNGHQRQVWRIGRRANG